MTDREKLIELLDEATDKLKELCGGYNDGTGNSVRADHLIANGVTFATDTTVGDKTNADRIRAMSEEELAKFFGRYGFCGGVIPNSYCCKQSVCSQECVVRWLKQPAEVDHARNFIPGKICMG